MLQLKECATAAEVMANARAVKQRVSGWKQPVDLSLLRREIEKSVEDRYLPIVADLRAQVEHWRGQYDLIMALLPQKSEVVAQPVEPEEKPARTVAGIKRLVAAASNLDVALLDSDQRRAPVVRARQIAMYLAYEHTPNSTPSIGRKLGGRDHTTVMHGHRKIATLRTLDSELDDHIRKLEAQLGI